MKEKITQTIFTVVDEVNAELPDTQHLDKTQETILFGEGGKLDSMGLVNFVVAAEQKIAEEFDRPISISDERAMSQRNSPFRTIGTLVDYIELLLKEDGNEQ